MIDPEAIKQLEAAAQTVETHTTAISAMATMLIARLTSEENRDLTNAFRFIALANPAIVLALIADWKRLREALTKIAGMEPGTDSEELECDACVEAMLAAVRALEGGQG